MNQLFVQELASIDFSYLCLGRGLVGETLLIDLLLTGDLNNEGMLIDFNKIKKDIRHNIELFLDHKLLVPINAEQISQQSDSTHTRVTLDSEKRGVIQCYAPHEAIRILSISYISWHQLSTLTEQMILKILPENVKALKIDMYPETISGAWYHYSHGLQTHLGDCQRIAHGHRSAIKIYIDNIREPTIEQTWASRWKDIYIANESYVIDKFDCNDVKQVRFGYTAQQGYFELVIPEKQCYLIPSETTVELISKHICDTLSKIIPNKKIEIIAYEGRNKGAVTCADNRDKTK